MAAGEDSLAGGDEADGTGHSAEARPYAGRMRWPWHAAAALGSQIHAPKQYWRSAPRDATNVIAHAKVGQR